MDYIADLHIHSFFSRATSRESTLAGLLAWARVKGIQIVGTGDFTHPGWFSRLKEELEPAEPGLFRLKSEEQVPSPLPGVTPAPGPVRFILSAEVSSIYKRHGKVRKVHNLLYVPDFASAQRVNVKLAGIGNIESDGRPILGLDSRDLLEILLEQAPAGFLVPAHIWTPWFSLFGSRSGFDSIEECFGDLTSHVFALETGLSSDPDMNRLVSNLDRFALISNSDCHSPQKLGREVNLFATGFDFFSLRDALKGNRRETFRGTVEFFPEEGKYHFDGHRACKVCLDPAETRRLGLVCPVCARPLTVGVHHRVLELADRERPLYGDDAPGFRSLIPLPEVLGELLRVGPSSKEVMREFAATIGRFGSEFKLLLHTPAEEISRSAPLLGEAVSRIRSGRVIRHPGYDGEFGVIRVFEEGELERLGGQGSLFGDGAPRRGGRKKTTAGSLPPLIESTENDAGAPCLEPVNSDGPNPEQEAAVHSTARHVLVAAGPGTGKTYTLVARLSALINGEKVDPSRICAITFTTKAAAEVRERLLRAVGPRGEEVFVGTFHAFCLHRLRQEEPGLAVIGPESRERLVKRLFPEMTATERNRSNGEIGEFFLRYGEDGKREACPPPTETDFAVSPAVRRYLDELSRMAALDLDAVIPAFVQRMTTDRALCGRVRASVEHLFVDEFQDLNAGQFQLVTLLGETCRVFAIGDPDQAIYGFRGSDISFFFRFAQCPDTEQLSLTHSYRSAPEIIEAAGAVISHNRLRSGLNLLPGSRRRGTIELHRAPTPAAEAEFIVRRIEEIMGGIEHFSLHTGRGGDGAVEQGLSFGDIAVLYRLSKQAEEIGQALERRGIPFQQVGAIPFFMRPAVQGIYYFLQAAAGSNELADWLRLVQGLRGVGGAAVERLEEALPLTGDFFSAATGVELPAGAGRTLTELSLLIHRFTSDAGREGIASPLSGTLDFLGIDPHHSGVCRLLELASSFGSDLCAFAQHLRQQATATVYDERAEAVALMTLHSAKGLEFPVVFLPGVEEGLLPCALKGKGDVEEERRLFYVGLTRAKDHLILSSSAIRPWAGHGERRLSRFIAEIPPRLVTREAAPKKSRKDRPDATQLELF